MTKCKYLLFLFLRGLKKSSVLGELLFPLEWMFLFLIVEGSWNLSNSRSLCPFAPLSILSPSPVPHPRFSFSLTEVGDLGILAAVQQDVLRFQVPVNYHVSVAVIHPRDNLLEEPPGLCVLHLLRERERERERETSMSCKH